MNTGEVDNREGKRAVPLGRVAAFLWLIASLLLASAPVHSRAPANASPGVLSSSADIPAILRVDSAPFYLTDARRPSVWSRDCVRKFSGGLADGAAYSNPQSRTAAAARQGICRNFASTHQVDQKLHRYFDPQGPPRQV